MHANIQPSGLFSRAGIRYEVALDVIGAVIAHCAEVIGDERGRPTPDEARLRQGQAMQRRLRSERNKLDRRDAAAIESAISCYGPLARRLYADLQNDPATQAERAEQFRQANASLALEGMIVDDEDLAIQQLVICGALNTEEAVALVLRRHRGRRQ
jgi:hypothetical protein